MARTSAHLAEDVRVDTIPAPAPRPNLRLVEPTRRAGPVRLPMEVAIAAYCEWMDPGGLAR
ncbi:MAG: hypothetical protein AB7S26_24460 [Sandaracinaceae bacterium]